MKNFIARENIFIDQLAGSRFDVLKSISRLAEKLGITDDAQAVYEAFLWREDQCETGMEDGFAIPHAKSSAIDHAAVIVYKTHRALEWPSFDGKPVNTSIALLVPEAEAGTTHLKLLSNTATLLMDSDFRQEMQHLQNADQIAELINTGIGQIDDAEDDE